MCQLSIESRLFSKPQLIKQMAYVTNQGFRRKIQILFVVLQFLFKNAPIYWQDLSWL